MPSSNPVDILLQHDKWATRQILQACEKLTAEQFGQTFEIGPGSLQATTTHIISAMKRWTDVLSLREPAPRLDQDGNKYTPAQLLPLHDESTAKFAEIAKQYPLDQTVKQTRDGKEYTFTRGAVLAHVATHGMHHRAQCLNMLRQLGVRRLPMSSVIEWVRTLDAVQ
jgi:uncharacterized damage-inducible protein DinB